VFSKQIRFCRSLLQLYNTTFTPTTHPTPATTNPTRAVFSFFPYLDLATKMKGKAGVTLFSLYLFLSFNGQWQREKRERERERNGERGIAHNLRGEKISRSKLHSLSSLSRLSLSLSLSRCFRKRMEKRMRKREEREREERVSPANFTHPFQWQQPKDRLPCTLATITL